MVAPIDRDAAAGLPAGAGQGEIRRRLAENFALVGRMVDVQRHLPQPHRLNAGQGDRQQLAVFQSFVAERAFNVFSMQCVNLLVCGRPSKWFVSSDELPV